MNNELSSLLKYSFFLPVVLCTSGYSQTKPNILLINIDDLGWRDVGFMGSQYYETPNLDRLASKGMIFTNAYASAANCAPSRASMMSGKWTPRHGIYTVGSSERGKSENRKLIPTPNCEILSSSIPIFPEILKKAGYTTCISGKWHLTNNPKDRGFDVNIGGSHAGHAKSYYPPYSNVSLTPPTDDYYLTNLIMDKTLQFIDSVKNEPFFLYYSPYAVHTPIQPVKALLPKYKNKPEWNGQKNAEYATMIENVDTQIGRLIDLLEKKGKMDHTFIIFTSDNGGVYNITKQWPLRAGKGSPYEGGIKEPMFVVWKGKISPGTKSDVPVTNIDFFPTILEAAGVTPPADNVMDGKSLVPVLLGKGEIGERALYWHMPVYIEGGNKESQDPVFRTRPVSVIQYGNWKLLQFFEDNVLELYNLAEDTGEKKNLAKENPVKTKELFDMLEKWRKETGAPVPVQLNPEYISKHQ